MSAPGAGQSAGEFLRALIAAQGGSISVERFMREALYHPQYGYYARRVRTVGREGDFSTSATLHPALGQAIAAWAYAHRAKVTRRGTWHLIELGGGNGQLAAGILQSLGWWARRGLHYHLVEVSEGLRGSQRERLRGAGGMVRWHAEIGSALAAAAGHALIFSNEFVDAFPCVQLVRGEAAEEWREVRVGWPEDAGQPQEIFGGWDGVTPCAGSADGSVGSQRIELHLSYRRWLEGCVQDWKSGRLLTIDYGDLPPALYWRRPRGTLRAYCRHQRIVGSEIYQRFGQQDLTADVNFGDLQRWGEALGLSTQTCTTQADFLQRWLPAKLLKRVNSDPALAFLLNPDGAGGAFKVLEQGR